MDTFNERVYNRIMYTKLKGVCPKWQRKKYMMKTPVTEVWHKIVGTTIYFRKDKANDSYSDSALTSSQKTAITKAVFETEVVPNSVASWFGNYTKLAEIEHLDYLDTSNATSLFNMFGNRQKIKTLDLSSFDTSNVEEMSMIFMRCSVLENVNVLNWDTSNVEQMGRMFSNCLKLKSLDLSDFDTHNVTLMETMFNECKTLTSLDLRSFDTSKVTSMKNMFLECKNLTTIQVSSLWKTAEEHTDMYKNCLTSTTTLVE